MSLTFKKTKIWDNNRYDEIIDVRSPGEYFEDHIVGSTNLPVLYDYEREIVGKIYKNISPFKAKILASSDYKKCFKTYKYSLFFEKWILETFNLLLERRSKVESIKHNSFPNWMENNSIRRWLQILQEGNNK